MARNLRRWLWKAGVRRAALHTRTATSLHLTWHDLRATGATWMAVRGDDAHKIMQRCGHKSFTTTMLYVREGEAIREGFGEPFPALPACLFSNSPESPRDYSIMQKQREFSGVDGTRIDSREVSETPCLQADRAHDPSTQQTPERTRLDKVGQASDTSDADLERAIVGAVSAGCFDVAKTLAAQLEDRKRARTPSNVVALVPRRA